MKRDFAALSYIPLKAKTTFEHPPTPPELIRLDSPAVTVMTDFQYVHPVTVNPDMPIDDALQKMKTAGVRLLLVTDEVDEIIGLITAKDIMGEKPIQIVQDTRIQRSDIKVEMIMTPQSNITVLNMVSVRNAQVGHIIETLRQLERQHMLVVDVDDASKTQRVIGLFSTSQISKLLGRDVREEVAPAHSLVEMLHQRG
ncbi:MAG: CBS domain-containing protein [Acidiferrobacterales bacterium]